MQRRNQPCKTGGALERGHLHCRRRVVFRRVDIVLPEELSHCAVFTL